MLVKKILIGIGLVGFVFSLFFFFNRGEENISFENESLVYQNTINISRAYIALRVKTDKLLTEASTYPDYDTWNAEMTKLLSNWKHLETKAALLEAQSNFEDNQRISFDFVNSAQAYTKDEISNVFDKAKAGQKIRTLAKYLGVDAKRAFEILKTDQDFVKADAWNEAGDEFQRLENSATILKDGCKILGFAGALVVSGGTASAVGGGAGAVSSAGGALVATVVGTDLILEISGDGATIALGNENKTTKYISKIRSESYMEPAAAVLSLTSLADANKAEVLIMHAETLRSALQDKKILGIDIPTPGKDKITVAGLDNSELTDWIEDREKSISPDTDEAEGYFDDDWEEEVAVLEDWLDSFEAEDVMDLADEENLLADKTDTEAIDDLEEWLEGFEDLEAWLDESGADEDSNMEEEIQEEIVDVEIEEERTDEENKSQQNDIVETYMQEIQGQPMDDYQTAIGYAKKFQELEAQGVISQTERYKLNEEINRISEILKKKKNH